MKPVSQTEEQEKNDIRTRRRVHVAISVVFVLIILLIEAIGSDSIINAIYKLASYTYGPLLGLYFFGLYTHVKPADKYVPWVALSAPVLCFVIELAMKQWFGYQVGYELLLLNGLITGLGLYVISKGEKNDYQIRRIHYQQYRLPEMSAGREAGVCLYRSLQRGQIIAHQYAHQPQKPGYDFINPRKDDADQSFSDQRRMVSGGFAGIWVRKTGKRGQGKIRGIIEDYILGRETMTNLFVLVDSRHEPQQIDLEFMEWLGENGVPFAIVFTKVDKLGSGRLQMNMDAYKEKLLETWEELPPLFVTSAEKGQGREELLHYIEMINQNMG